LHAVACARAPAPDRSHRRGRHDGPPGGRRPVRRPSAGVP
jgi:hypothetical protein